MPTKTLLKPNMRVTVAGRVQGFHDVGGREVVTVAIDGQMVSFDTSWLPDAAIGDEVRLPGKITRLMLPRVAVKLDAFGTPVTQPEEAVRRE